MDAEITEVPTPHGPARLHLHRPAADPVGLVMLGHGAGGGITAADLQLATGVALDAGAAVALIEQPYRVAGRKAPAPPAQVDAAWIAVATHLTGRSDAAAYDDAPPGGAMSEGTADRPDNEPPQVPEFTGLPLVTGGRSFGARVACRTSGATGSSGVLCLAFPLHPPGRPEKSRQAELSGVTVPALVIQGEKDPFGRPEGSDSCEIVVVAGDHSLKKDAPAIRAAIAGWLPTVLG